MTTTETIAQHLADTLRPSDATTAAAQALIDAGLGQPNGEGHDDDRLIYSLLLITGNPSARWTWTGDERVTDIGALFLERSSAYDRADELVALKDSGLCSAVAVVVHRHAPGRPARFAAFIV